MAEQTYYLISGQVWFDGGLNALADALTSAGLKVVCGRYAVTITDFSHFVLQSVGEPNDCGIFDVDADADTEAEMLEIAERASNALCLAKIRHEFEVFRLPAKLPLKSFTFSGR